jgi:hypothetical protein
MKSVIRICHSEYLRAIECLLLWRYTSSSYHWCIVKIISHRSDGIAWTCVRYVQLLRSDGGRVSRNILIGFIQSYTGSCSDLLITIRSLSIASLTASTCLTEGLDSFSIITSDGVGAMEEMIHDRHHGCPDAGHTILQTH